VPTNLRLQVAIKADTFLPRDAIVNTLYFSDVVGSPDEDALCNDLAVIYRDYWMGSPTEIVVKSYDNDGTPPVLPNGQAIISSGVGPRNSTVPREQALCLSFYAGQNVPRKRGRIYLPAGCADSAANLGGLRPATALMNRALSLAQKFADLGGANIAWKVYSPTTNEYHSVTNAWVDDEWDTQRRRGLRPTTRVSSAPGS
jgi:hypothetical protein